MCTEVIITKKNSAAFQQSMSKRLLKNKLFCEEIDLEGQIMSLCAD